MSPTVCGVPECDREASIMKRPWPSRVCCAGEDEKDPSSSHLLTAVSDVKIVASRQELLCGFQILN